jgi:GAF domain-containing protein
MRPVSRPSPIAGNPLQAILEVSAALVSSLELDEVFARVVEKIGEAMSVWSVDISTYVPEREIMIYEAYWCEGGASAEDLAYIGTVANLRERPDLQQILTLTGPNEERIDDLTLPEQHRRELAKWGYKTAVDAPLRVGDVILGTCGIQEKRYVRSFTPVEMDLFDKLCTLAAIAIHNARVYRSEQERGRHLASLIDVGLAVAAGTDDRTLFPAIARAGAAALDAPRALVYEYDAQADRLIARGAFQQVEAGGYDRTGTPETIEEVLGVRSLLTGGAHVEHLSDPDLDAGSRRILEQWGEKTALTVPMIFGGRPLGILEVAWTEREQQLTGDDLALAGGIADQAAAALHNLRRRQSGAIPSGGGGE